MSSPYSISSRDIDGIITEINLILSNISDRLDAIEGKRGTSTIENRLDLVDATQNRVGGFTNEAL